MSSETFYNITQAARATGKSIPTIRKYLRDGRLPNAKETKNGGAKSFSIPLSDLVAAGLMDKAVGQTQEATALSEATATGERLGRLVSEVEQLTARLAEHKETIRDLRATLSYERASIETKEVQATRRSWFSKKPQPQPQPLRDKAEWNSDTD